jgi:hypothetical protein
MTAAVLQVPTGRNREFVVRGIGKDQRVVVVAGIGCLRDREKLKARFYTCEGEQGAESELGDALHRGLQKLK